MFPSFHREAEHKAGPESLVMMTCLVTLHQEAQKIQIQWEEGPRECRGCEVWLGLVFGGGGFVGDGGCWGVACSLKHLTEELDF